jgi:hypothetical protein
MITPGDWERIRALFQIALARPPDERARFVRVQSAGDDVICREVASLLAAHDEAEGFLDDPGRDPLFDDDADPCPPPSLAPGSRLGPFEILGPLGAGGMGEVYHARDTRLDRTVALKVLPAVTAADPDARRRFEREARTISRLNHPHICTLHDVGSAPGLETVVRFITRAGTSGPEISGRFHSMIVGSIR